MHKLKAVLPKKITKEYQDVFLLKYKKMFTMILERINLRCFTMLMNRTAFFLRSNSKIKCNKSIGIKKKIRKEKNLRIIKIKKTGNYRLYHKIQSLKQVDNPSLRFQLRHRIFQTVKYS